MGSTQPTTKYYVSRTCSIAAMPHGTTYVNECAEAEAQEAQEFGEMRSGGERERNTRAHRCVNH